jgi:transposase
LDEADKTVLFQRTTHILIVDNATWHRGKDTHWHRWQPKYLPPYSPDLNPIERIWLTMKARWFNNYVCKNQEQLLERLDQAILDVINNPKKTQKTACIGTLL